MIKIYFKKLIKVCLALAFVLSSTHLMAQNIGISGTVVDDNGEPVVGASVVVKGTQTGVITGIDGDYSIQAPTSGTLIFSFIGMGEKEESVNGRSKIDVALSESANELDDVVVIGYGTVRKRDLTGAVSSVRGNDITTIPTSNAMDAIQGRVAGMDIVQSSGKAGSGVDIRIRGNRSINIDDKEVDRNKPLFIIDGVGGGSYEDLNPNDIESIEVLKDASSTAIYGSQGANGVVLITTKKGLSGQTRVSYDGYFGLNGLSSYPEARMGDDYIKLRTDAWRANNNWAQPSSLSEVFTNVYELGAIERDEWVNWVDLTLRNATQQSHSVSVRTGTEKTRAFMSVNYFKEEGIVKLDDAQRITARMNLDQTINKWAKAGMNFQYTHWDINNRSESVVKNGLSSRPLGKAYDEDGRIKLNPVDGMADYINPLLDEYDSDRYKNNQNKNNLSLSAYVELTPIEEITFVSRLGATMTSNRTGVYYDSISTDISLAGPNRAQYKTDITQTLKWENIITFRKTFNNIHAVGLTGITSTDISKNEVADINAKGIEIPSYLFYNMGSSLKSSQTMSTKYEQSTGNSVALRAEYGLMDKYLLTASIRWDGASRLADGHKWDYFPSVAAAWHIGDEGFMDPVRKYANDIKLRVSYGVTGNSSINIYGTQSLAETVEEKFAFGDVSAPVIGFGKMIANKDLGWEKSASIDAGLDISFFNSRINLTVDYYNTKTTDILMKRKISSTAGGLNTGVYETYQNIASTRNQGVEILLNTVNIQKKDWRWTTTFTFSRNKEEILSLYDGLNEIVGSNLFVGYPVKSFYNWEKLGIWQSSEAQEAARYTEGSGATIFKPGDIKIKDQNGDYKITDEDKVVIGSEVPKWFAGLNNTISYKSFDLSIYLFARWGQMINAEFLGRYEPEGVNNGPAYFEYWTPENETNDFPAPGKAKSSYTYFNTLNYVDGSYFKIKTLSLGYTLPRKYAQAVRLEKLRVYVTANNLLTVAKSHLIKYYDPERGGSEKTPLSKQFVIGVNLEF